MGSTWFWIAIASLSANVVTIVSFLISRFLQRRITHHAHHRMSLDPDPDEIADSEWLEAPESRYSHQAQLPSPDEFVFAEDYLVGTYGGVDAEPVVKLSLPQLAAQEYRVWFGTNRKPVVPDHLDWGFSTVRGDRTYYGHCDVFVPESHKIGSRGSSLLKRLVTLTDDRLKVRKTRLLEKPDFWSAVKDQISKEEKGQRHAVVFIHGYNVLFQGAALQAAQIGFDLGVSGAMAFFSWPSAGDVEGYAADGSSIEASEGAIADFLVDFGAFSCAEFVHVIAHSMGNRGLLRAMNRIVADAGMRSKCQFGELILAAADVDVDTFNLLSAAYRQMAPRTTLYVSERDRALSLSRWLHEYPRVGLSPPVSTFDGMDTISVTDIDLTTLGHGYVAGAREVLNDMHQLIFDGKPPEERFGLAKRKSATGSVFWQVRA